MVWVLSAWEEIPIATLPLLNQIALPVHFSSQPEHTAWTPNHLRDEPADPLGHPDSWLDAAGGIHILQSSHINPISWRYTWHTLWKWRLQFSNWKIAIEIGDLLMKIAFNSYVNVYQRVIPFKSDTILVFCWMFHEFSSLTQSHYSIAIGSLPWLSDYHPIKHPQNPWNPMKFHDYPIKFD